MQARQFFNSIYFMSFPGRLQDFGTTAKQKLTRNVCRRLLHCRPSTSHHSTVRQEAC